MVSAPGWLTMVLCPCREPRKKIHNVLASHSENRVAEFLSVLYRSDVRVGLGQDGRLGRNHFVAARHSHPLSIVICQWQETRRPEGVSAHSPETRCPVASAAEIWKSKIGLIFAEDLGDRKGSHSSRCRFALSKTSPSATRLRQGVNADQARPVILRKATLQAIRAHTDWG